MAKQSLREHLHEIVFQRYVRMPYGHLLDAADENGEAVIPTAEECKAFLPSGLGWTTPIADCAMFGGLYVFALLELYSVSPSASLQKELHLLMDGLFLLSDVAEIDGFIARGVSDDGVTHYPISSDDQVGPWILALWKALCSNAFDTAAKDRIRSYLVRTISGLIRQDWAFPNEPVLDGTYHGSFLHGGWRDCARFLLAAAVARELGLLSASQFEDYATAVPEGSLHTRREIVSHGCAQDMVRDPVLQQFWITVCSHLSVCELIALDPNGKAGYEQAVALNAVTASRFAQDTATYTPDAFPAYDHDWRKILPKLNRCHTYAELLKEGRRANDLYKEICPLRMHERKTLGQVLFSAWVAIASGDRAVAEHTYATLCTFLSGVDWSRVGQSYAFAAEAAMIAYEVRWRA